MSSFYPELDNLNLGQLIERFHGPNVPDGEFIYYDEIAYRIRKQGKLGNKFLLKALKEVDENDAERLRALSLALSFRTSERENIQPLSRHFRSWFQEQLFHYLDDDRPLIIGESVMDLCDTKKAWAPVERLRKHATEHVRWRVIYCLGSLNLKRAVPILLEALTDISVWVREEALDQLFGLRDGKIIRQVLPSIYPLLSDPEPRVSESAKATIENLEGWLKELEWYQENGINLTL